jgi:hypothetical protein
LFPGAIGWVRRYQRTEKCTVGEIPCYGHATIARRRGKNPLERRAPPTTAKFFVKKIKKFLNPSRKSGIVARELKAGLWLTERHSGKNDWRKK